MKKVDEWKQLFGQIREFFEKACEFTDKHVFINKYLRWVNLGLIIGVIAFVLTSAQGEIMTSLHRQEIAWKKAQPEPEPEPQFHHQVIDIVEPTTIKGNSMGAHSTLNISRKAALRKIMMELLDASDDQLEETLYALWGDDKLYNFTVGSDDKDDSVLE